jgi:Domain of unknown function (DUF6089)
MKILRLKYVLLICLQVGSIFFASAQSTSELGLGIGATNYKGEIAPHYRLANNRPAITVFYKKDISKPIALRASLLAGMLRANDEDVNLPVHQQRRAAMQTNLAEFSAGIDYKFLDYYDQRQRIRWTPYFFIGAAVANYNNRVVFANNTIKPFENGFVFSVPAGIGFKYALSYHWNLGLEIAARKTLLKAGERLDYLRRRNYESNPPAELPYANPHDKDWYYYSGISLSYTFYKIICPDVYRRNPSLLH